MVPGWFYALLYYVFHQSNTFENWEYRLIKFESDEPQKQASNIDVNHSTVVYKLYFHNWKLMGNEISEMSS